MVFMMENIKRLIDANALMEHLERCIEEGKGLSRAILVAVKCFVVQMPTVDAVMLSDLEAWLYEIAMNNVGEKFDGDFSDAVEEIISRLDGLRVFAEEGRTDG